MVHLPTVNNLEEYDSNYRHVISHRKEGAVSDQPRIFWVLGILGFVAFFWGLSGLPVVIVDPEGTAFVPYAIAFVVGGVFLFIAARLMRK